MLFILKSFKLVCPLSEGKNQNKFNFFQKQIFPRIYTGFKKNFFAKQLSLNLSPPKGSQNYFLDRWNAAYFWLP